MMDSGMVEVIVIIVLELVAFIVLFVKLSKDVETTKSDVIRNEKRIDRLTINEEACVSGMASIGSTLKHIEKTLERLEARNESRA